MFWNYRLLKQTAPDGYTWYTLVEAYYEDGATEPHDYAEPHAISADSPTEVFDLLIRAEGACDKPPIALVDGKAVTVEYDKTEDDETPKTPEMKGYAYEPALTSSGAEWVLEAKGAFLVPQGMTHDEFLGRLFEFMESIGAAWGGSTRPIEDDEC